MCRLASKLMVWSLSISFSESSPSSSIIFVDRDTFDTILPSTPHSRHWPEVFHQNVFAQPRIVDWGHKTIKCAVVQCQWALWQTTIKKMKYTERFIHNLWDLYFTWLRIRDNIVIIMSPTSGWYLRRGAVPVQRDPGSRRPAQRRGRRYHQEVRHDMSFCVVLCHVHVMSMSCNVM